MVPKGPLDPLVRQELPVLPVSLVQQDQLVLKEPKELKGLLELRVRKVLLVPPALKVFKALLVLLEHKVRLDWQALQGLTVRTVPMEYQPTKPG
jgi:hypothetical protein